MEWLLPPVISGQVVTIHTLSFLSLGCSTFNATVSSATWPVANKAYYIPFRLPVPIVVNQLFFFNGATASGNIDVGIYDQAGTRLTSAGSTAQSGTNALQAFDITDIQLGPGWFYLAGAASATATTVFRFGMGVVERCKLLGVLNQTSALALPAVATFAIASEVNIPIVGLAGRVTL